MRLLELVEFIVFTEFVGSVVFSSWLDLRGWTLTRLEVRRASLEFIEFIGVYWVCWDRRAFESVGLAGIALFASKLPAPGSPLYAPSSQLPFPAPSP